MSVYVNLNVCPDCCFPDEATLGNAIGKRIIMNTIPDVVFSFAVKSDIRASDRRLKAEDKVKLKLVFEQKEVTASRLNHFASIL